MTTLLDRTATARRNMFHYLRDGETIATSCSYDELDDAVRDAAAFLYHACDLREGQHVLITLRDPLRFAISFLACQYVGAVPVGLSSNLNRYSVGGQLATIARDSRATLLLTDAMRQEHTAIETLREQTAIKVVGIGDRFESGYPVVTRVDSPVAFVQYTSGSTQEPKGSVVSRTALHTQFELLVRTFGFSEQSRFVNWLPLHHDMGLVSKLLLPYHLGATSVHMLPATFMQRPSRWLRAIDQFGGTVSSAPNFAYELCLHIAPEELQGIDLSSWSSAVCGAEAVRHATLAAFAERFSRHGFHPQALCPAYGMAEATLLVTARRGLAHDAPGLVHKPVERESIESLGALASCGLPEEGGPVIKIVNAANRSECAAGQVGEIWVSASSLADGYVHNGHIERQAFAHVLPQDPSRSYLATGDLGYMGRSGLHVLGRVGSAIAVAGRKYFFTDIEFAMTQLDARFAPNCAGAFSRDGGQSLTLVYQVRASAINVDEFAALGEACAAKVEALFPITVSAVLFTTRPLPRTSSGKLQRERARELFEAGRLLGTLCVRDARLAADVGAVVEGQETSGPALEIIARLLGLSVQQVEVERTLVELGADSLTIVRIQFELERRFGCALNRARMYASARVGDLLEDIRVPATRADALPAPYGRNSFPATHYQRALVFAQTLAGAPIYTLQRAVRITGGIELEVLQRALVMLELKHAALCSQLLSGAAGLDYVVDCEATQPVVLEELDGDDGARARLHAWAARGLEADAARLYRVVLLRSSDNVSYLLLQVHHAVADFWSFLLVWRDLLACYQAAARNEPLAQLPGAVAYGQYCLDHQSYLASEQVRKDVAFWQGTLDPAGDPRLPLLSHGLERYESRRERSELPADLVKAIQARAASAGTTVGCVLQLALEASLAVLTRRRRVRYGVALLNRAGRYQETVGMFANLVPVDAQVDLAAPINDALVAVRDRLSSALAHEAMPLTQLGTDLAASASTPGTCFDVVFAYFEMAGLDAGPGGVDVAFEREHAHIRLGDLELSPYPLTPAYTHYPVQMQLLGDKDQLQLCVDYRCDALEPLLASSWLEQFRFALEVIAKDTTVSLSEATRLPPAVSQRLHQWGVEPGTIAPSTLVRIVDNALAHPQATALISAGDDETWSYARLLETASQYARQVLALAHGLDGHQPVVAVMLPRSPSGVAACLGVMLAGGVYLPIDPTTPASRRDYMLRDSGAVAVIAQAGSLPLEIALPMIDAEQGMDAMQALDALPYQALPGDAAAYLLYTSGSTGQPKGVLISHRALDNRLDWMIDRLALSRADVFVQKTIWTFDVSLWEILAPLALGAKAVCIQPAHERFPETVAAAIAQHGVTVAHFVPSVLGHWLGIEGVCQALAGLRQVVCSGERLLEAQARAFFDAAPQVRLYNFYGPTEAGIDVTYAQVHAHQASISIGRPAPNCEVSIVDGRGLAVLPGAEGELVVGGPQVAIGYVGKAMLSATQFTPSPLGSLSRCYRTGDRVRFDASGNIHYLGRQDGQVKVAGYRIELAEIEQAISSLAGVRNAVVLLDEVAGAERLCAFLQVEEHTDLTPRDVEAHVRAWLPEFMVPREWRLLTHWPLLASGKADSAQLRSLLVRENGLLPVDEAHDLRSQLAGQWQRVLGGAPPLDEDDFFACGGDSILALHFIGRLRAAGIALSVQTLFRHSSFGAMHAQIENTSWCVSPSEPIAPFSLLSERDRAILATDDVEDAYPLSYLQRGILFKYFNDDHYEVFVTTLELVTPWDERAMHSALKNVTAEHGFLRTCIDIERFDEPIQIVRRCVELPLVVEDLTTLPAEQRQARLDAWISAEKKRAFAWEAAPHFRCSVHLLDSERFQLTFADAALDGWCVATVLTELLQAYSAYRALQQPLVDQQRRLSYAEFVALEQQALTSSTQRHFWSQLLANSKFNQADLPPTAPSAVHSRLTWQVEPQWVERLETIGQAAGVPLKNLLMAVHFSALSSVTGVPEQCSGMEFNGRPELSGGERCVGVFNNLLPIAINLQGSTWRQLMETCFETERSYLPYRRFPYAQLVAMNGGRTLFDTLFVYTHFHVYRGLLHMPLHVASHYASDQTYVPLTIHFNRDHGGEGLRILFDYDARRVDVTHVERLRAVIVRTLHSLARCDSIDEALAEIVFPGPPLPVSSSLNVTLDDQYA
jgi:amino acid adenylation domain-containing protein